MKKVTLLFVIISVLSFNAIADELPINKVSSDHLSMNWQEFIDTFTQCGVSFFSEIYNNKEALNQITDVIEFGDGQAFIQVMDRTDNNNNAQYFTSPIIYKDLTIIGYYDSVINLGKYGDYYFWGFIFDNDIEDITHNFSQINWQNMENGQLYIAYPLIRTNQDNLNQWHANTDSVVGAKTIPEPGTTEKLLLLEKGPMTSLLCSIQGFVPFELLSLERPDIKQRPNYSGR